MLDSFAFFQYFTIVADYCSFSNNSCWITSNDAMFRDIVTHNRTASHINMVANLDTRHDHGTPSYDTILPNISVTPHVIAIQRTS